MRISDWSSDVCSSDLITLEANPSSVEAGRFADFRAAGVNRVSLGVQALDDDALRFLGRRHDLAAALTEIGRASCRERVCQSVSISVVAVSLKKKDMRIKR